MSTQLVTPHIAWAKPYTGKKLRILVIAPRWMQRGTVELMERLDADCVPMLTYAPPENEAKKGVQGALWCSGNFWAHQKDPDIKQDAVLKDLRAKLTQDWDVVVFCLASEQDFPPDVVDQIKKHVANGTGLVFLTAEDTASECYKALTAAATAPYEPLSSAANDPADAPTHDWFTKGTPYVLLSWSLNDPVKHPEFLQLRECGQGRLVQCCWRGGQGDGLTPACTNDLEYEYLTAVTIKAILWAGKQVPAIQFHEFPDLLDGHNPKANLNKLDFTLQNSGAACKLKATVAIRCPMRLYHLPQMPLTQPGVQETAEFIAPVYTQTNEIDVPVGSSNFNFDLPTLPATAKLNYFVDVRLADDQGQAVNWAFTQIRPGTLAQAETTLEFTPAVLDMKLNPTTPPLLTINLLKTAATDLAARITLVDNRDRLLGTQDATLPAGQQQLQVPLAIPVGQIMASMLMARVELQTAQGQPVWIGLADLPVVHRPWPDFTFFMWAGGSGYIGRQRLRAVAGLGVDGGRVTAAPEVTDMRQANDVWGMSSKADSKTQTLARDYSSPEYRKDMTDKLAAMFLKGKQRITQDSFAYLMGDESVFCAGGLVGTPVSPSATAGLRSFLQSRYGDIAKLNAEWGTTFASFDEITPGKPLNELSAQAKKSHNYAIWLDQWLYNDWLYADTMKFLLKEIRKYDSSAQLGMSTPLWNYYYRAYDWPGIMSVCSFASPYGPLNASDLSNSDSMRAFLPKGGSSSYCFGSYLGQELTDLNHFRLMSYLALFRGASNVFWFIDWGNEGGFSPWLEPYPFMQATADAIHEIKNGIGSMWLGATEPHQIAVQYSRTSQLFWGAAGGPHPAFAGNAMTLAIREMGLQPWMVSSQQIEQGGLAGYKVLLLPSAQTVSDQEARAIEDFADAGGVVIAYYRPGIADQDGKLKTNAALPKMFGLHWTDKLFVPADVIDKKTGESKPGNPEQFRALIKVDAVPVVGVYRAIKFSCPTDAGQMDDAVAVDDAQVLASANGVPAITCRPVGKGVAIAINASDEKDNVLRVLLAAVFKAHGIASCAQIQNQVQGCEPGLWMPGLDVTRVKDGPAEYLGIIRVQPAFVHFPEEKLTVDLGGGKHVYNPCTGQYLGVKDKMELSLPGSSTYLYALLPYAVTAVQAQIDKSQYTCGETMQATAKIVADSPALVQHVIHMEVVRPDGQPVPYLCGNVNTTDGTAHFSMPLCLNEPAGKWMLTFTDAATKISQSVAVQVDATRPPAK